MIATDRLVRPAPSRLIVAALLCAAASVFDAPFLVRAAAGLALVLYLPGAAVLLFFPRTGRAFHVVIAIGLSAALTIIVGLLLNALHHLDRSGWTLAMTGLAILPAALAWLALAPGALEQVPQSQAARLPHPRWQHVATFATAVLVVCAAVGLARQGAQAHAPFRFTEFWLVPAGASAPTYELGVRNGEGRTTNYAIELANGNQRVGYWPDVTLQPGEVFRTELSAAASSRPGQRFEARLYREGARGAVYRRVWLPLAQPREF